MLTNSQIKAKEAIKKFLDDPIEEYICLSGKPGTGKSYFIKNIIPQLTDKWVSLTATTNKAANVIGGETTFSHFGLRVTFKEGDYIIDTKNLNSITDEVVIIDEASMLDWELFQIVTTNITRCKIIFVGDMNQLPAVKGGINVFEKFKVIELTDVVRQKKDDLIELIESARNHIKLAKVIDSITPTENIKILHSKQEIEDVITSMSFDDKILAYTNKTVIAYNRYYRELTNRPVDIQEGDLVVSKSFCQSINDDKCRLYAEEEGVVSSISDPFELYGFTGFMVRKVNIMGKNGDFLMPCNVDTYRTLLKQFAKDKAWREYFIFKEKIADLRDNMACTVHAAQGSTYNNVLIDMRDIKTCRVMSTKTRLIYVALSRAKEGIYIYDGSNK